MVIDNVFVAAQNEQAASCNRRWSFHLLPELVKKNQWMILGRCFGS